MIKIGSAYKAHGRQTPPDDGRRKARYKFCVRKGAGNAVSACLAVLSRTWRNSQKKAETADDESFRLIYTMPGRRGRRIYLWRPRRGESGSARQSLQIV